MQLTEIGAPLQLQDVTLPERPEEGNASVEIKCAALNRRDYWIQQGQYPKIDLPITLGSDGSGTIDGRDVIINPGLNWGSSERYQGRDFKILGMPAHGTLAESVIVPEENVHDKPAHLSWEEAAALPLAGVTAYRALFVQGEARRGQSVLISGVGGGVALTAMQFAIAQGMNVFMTSGSDAKIERALALGATGAVNYNDNEWIDKLSKLSDGFDIALDSAGGEGFREMQKLVRSGGKIVVYGGTLGKISHISPHLLYWRQVTIRGTTMGSPKDFSAMIDFVNKYQIKPVIDSVFELKDVNKALERLRDSAQFGKIVIRIAS